MNDGLPWLAAYTRPRHEERVKRYCEERGFEVFLPCYRSWRKWSDRRKQLSLPLFPSYLFVRLSQTERPRASQAPGFLWFVHNQSGAIHVDAAELGAIRSLLASGLEFDPMPAAQLGDEVEVVAGALRGTRGRLVQKDIGRIVLMVSAIRGAVRVTLPDPSWVTRCSS